MSPIVVSPYSGSVVYCKSGVLVLLLECFLILVVVRMTKEIALFIV